VTYDYDSDGPGTPSNFGKSKSGSCTYEVRFKTADDGGKTNKVELYRSENKSFTADAGTRVGSTGIGSNQNGQINDTPSDCGKTYYYVIRAFDSIGNGSGLIGDRDVTYNTTYVTTGSTTTTLTTEQGALLAAAGTNLSGRSAAGTVTTGENAEEAQKTEESPAPQSSPSIDGGTATQEEGKVLGAQTNTLGEFAQNAAKKIFSPIGIAVVIGLIVLTGVFSYVRSKQSGKKTDW
jgi:hypothetical protein